jgi:hypothetical protein
LSWPLGALRQVSLPSVYHECVCVRACPGCRVCACFVALSFPSVSYPIISYPILSYPIAADRSTATEVALKMAFRRLLSSRRLLEEGQLLAGWEGLQLGVLGVAGGYHGDTLGAMDAVSTSPFNGLRQTPWCGALAGLLVGRSVRPSVRLSVGWAAPSVGLPTSLAVCGRQATGRLACPSIYFWARRPIGHCVLEVPADACPRASLRAARVLPSGCAVRGSRWAR